MENKSGVCHLTGSERELIRRLYGFGCKRKNYDEILKSRPETTREDLQRVEIEALRKLRHLDVNEIAELRRAG